MADEGPPPPGPLPQGEGELLALGACVHPPSTVPAGTRWPRRKASAVMTGRPANWTRARRSACAPHAIVSLSSSAIPGDPDPHAGSTASTFSTAPCNVVNVPGQGSNAPGPAVRSPPHRAPSRYGPPRASASAHRSRPPSGCGNGTGCSASARRISRAAQHSASTIVQFRRGRGCADRNRLAQQHRAGVQSSIHLHDGDAGLRRRRKHRGLNRRGPPPAWQEAGVNVQTAVAWRLQHRLRQDQPIGRHHAASRPSAANAVCSAGSPRSPAGVRTDSPAAVLPTPRGKTAARSLALPAWETGNTPRRFRVPPRGAPERRDQRSRGCP